MVKSNVRALARKMKQISKQVRGATYDGPRRKLEFGTLVFRCNICGADCCAPAEKLQREVPSCEKCGSTVRMRSIIHVLSIRLFGRSIPLPDFPVDPNIKGIGLSDSEAYAERLAQKLNYVNTYYHKKPQFDIAAEASSSFHDLTFLISSDVFEHVAPPVSRAFKNSFHLLKPGGVFVLTVPYSLNSDTVEHFPDLHQYEIVEREGKRVLRNVTKDRREQIFDSLVFHGGEGETLEMRVFSETAVLRHLEETGFRDIIVHREHFLEFGIYQSEQWSLPISARA